MAQKRPEGHTQVHFWVLEEDWHAIKTYCNRSGKRLFATDFARVFLASLAAEMRQRMEEGNYASEIDLSRVKPMAVSMMKKLEGDPE
jgi:hypothetical protein